MAVVAGFLLSGCADRSGEIQGSYVSPLQYQNFSCAQLTEEARRITSRANQVAGVQDSKASNDAVAMGVGLVLFWPSLFFIRGDRETRAELARLKGELDAIEQMSIRKNCGIKFETRTREG